MENQERIPGIVTARDVEKELDELYRNGVNLHWNIDEQEGWARYSTIREMYVEWLPIIMEQSKKRRRAWVRPYFADWAAIFTPIEYDAWCTIREIGVPLYPQVPVSKYFIDFASPYVKIGLEVDGKAFHNREDDQIRDQELRRHGWTVIRVTGSECKSGPDPSENLRLNDASDEEIEHAIEEWVMHSSGGVIRAIDVVYFGKRHYGISFDLACRSLAAHCLTDFSPPSLYAESLYTEDEWKD